MNHSKSFLFLALVASLLFACNKEKPEPQPLNIPQIILDTDIASSTDDLFAMQLLYRYASQGRCLLLDSRQRSLGPAHAESDTSIQLIKYAADGQTLRLFDIA